MIYSLTCVYRQAKVEKLWSEAFRSLCSCLSPMDIVCLNTTSVWTYQMFRMGSVNAPLSEFVARACLDRPEVLDGKPDYANSSFPEFFARARCPLSWCPLESQRSRCMVERRGVFKHNISYSSFSSTFFFLQPV